MMLQLSFLPGFSLSFNFNVVILLDYSFLPNFIFCCTPIFLFSYYLPELGSGHIATIRHYCILRILIVAHIYCKVVCGEGSNFMNKLKFNEFKNLKNKK